MRVINVTILENEMKPDSTIAGMAGDNLNTKLSIEIPESWAGCTYRLKFKTSNQPDGYAYVSDSISLTSGKIEFLLPSSVMVAGKLWVQSVAEKASGSDTVVVNSATMVLDVGRSIGDQCDEYGFPPNYSGLIDQTLNEINDEITAQANIAKTQAANSAASATAAANSAASAAAEANRSKSEADRAASIDAFTKSESDTRYSNALTGTAAGAMAHMTDVGIGSLRRLAVQGETIETGTGNKGPDNPYAVAGLTPAKATACGKNLLDWLGMPAGTTVGTWKYSGVTAAKANAAMVLTNTGAWGGIQTILPVNPGQKYSLSILADNPSGNGVGIAVCNGLIYDSQKLICNQYKTDTTVSLAATVAPSESYITVKFTANHQNASANGTVVTFREMQIEQGTAATAYEPYTGTTVTLPTLEPLYGNSTVSDEYDAAAGTETRRWKRLELDNTQIWAIGTAGGGTETAWFQSGPNSIQQPPNPDGGITCTHLPSVTANQLWATDAIGITISTGGRIQLRVPKTIASTAAELTAWLAAQKAAGTPVTVVYRLATPEVTQHDPERIVPPAPVCNAYADQGDVDVTYNRDINMALTVLPGDVATKEYVDQQLGAIENGSY